MGNELSAVSVLLVFVTVAFSLLMPSIWDEIGCRIDNFSITREVKGSKIKEINIMLYQKTLPLGIAVLALGWLLTPNTYSIITTSNFHLWNFDLLNTMFVLINISIYLMAAVVVGTFIRLLSRKSQLKLYFKDVN